MDGELAQGAFEKLRDWRNWGETGFRRNVPHFSNESRLMTVPRVDLCRGLGRLPEARASYAKALALLVPGKDQQEPERRFLVRRLAELK
jgi:hypothetical protein